MFVRRAANSVRTSLSGAYQELFERRPKVAQKFFEDAHKTMIKMRLSPRDVGWTKREIENLGGKITRALIKS